MNKKHLVLESLYHFCKQQEDFTFHNDLVKEMCIKHGFGNPFTKETTALPCFDVTKLDSSDKLPPLFKNQDICLLHLGGGYHQFIQGINKLYHPFEPLQDSVKWQYKKSLLNEYNDSESNILSVANNQRILHHFLFGADLEFADLSIENRPKTYFPHRTKANLNYFFGLQEIQAKNQQIEIDLTLEFNGIIGVFEAKNGIPRDFNIYQIYHPFLYYYNSNLNFKKIICVYLVRKDDSIKLWAYTFDKPLYLDSIKFLKSCEYILVRV
ncbi:hypothetical protein LS73_002030 [Helicobacter muridarum]|uniref:Uncharacterized protein n=1 Tax=Helicobacter muridarum TaxID=216 RepID=A0A099TYP1_9HELI|nr:hypothetical protein [Helicobacter muridarum]TLE01080.1 hypothetical protein LS73_002030 [Helicobacter muridarum]STQ85940.1 Uncharacterised protein [Helicobacter muridarum]